MIDFKLYLVTNRNLTGGRSLEEVIELACKAGVRAVQLREPDLTANELLQLARRLRTITSKHNAKLFINDRIDVALACDAEGVHLRESSLPIKEARKIIPRGKLIGASVHSAETALRAQEEGADFLLFGTIFTTQSKPSEPGVGAEAIRDLTQKVRIPILAIGGITPQRVAICTDAGAHGVAVISAIMEAVDIKATVEKFEEQLGHL